MIFGEGPIIKNIAGDLNKLFLQGSRAGQPVNVEGSAAADQATVALMADRDPVIRDISTGLGYAGREVTVSGTGALQLVNSLGRPLKSWSVELAPYQEGSGDPSPDNVRPIHGTDKINIVTASDNLLPFDFIQGSALILGQFDRVVSSILIPVIANNTYTFSASDYTNFMYVLNSGENNRLPFPASPSVSYQWCGHNVQWVQHDITFTATRSGYLAVVVRRPTNNAITPADISSIKMKFEVSATSTPHTDNATFVPITLPHTVYAGTIGSDAGESVGYLGIIGDTSFTNLTTRITRNTADTGTVFRLNPATDLKPISGNIDCLCSKLTPTKVANASMNPYTVKVNGQQFWVCLPVDTVEDAEAWFATERPELYYELANQTEFSLTSPTIPTPTGTATTWATAEDGIVDSMEVTYIGKA